MHSRSRRAADEDLLSLLWHGRGPARQALRCRRHRGVQYQERRDGQVASPSPPTRRLSRAYLQHEYANRHLLPHYVLVFGRRREFEVESDQNIDADALRRERDLANRPDE